MAKTLTCNTCKREDFKTSNGLAWHKAHMHKQAQAGTRGKAKSKRKASKPTSAHTQRIHERAQELLAEGFAGGFVKAKILAGRELGPAPKRERTAAKLPESGKSPAKPNRTRARRAKPTGGRVDASMMPADPQATRTYTQADLERIVGAAIAMFANAQA